VFHVKRDDAAPAVRLSLPPLPPLDPDIEAKLDSFLNLLWRWNGRINLVADREPDTIRFRHIDDSLQLLPLIPPGDGPMADLGSGGGFPGLILALATGRETHLVESDRRKAAFLTEAAARLGLAKVRVHATRIEQAALPPVAVLTARALAPLTDLLPHAARLLAPGGVAIFPKGRSAEGELTEALRGWHLQVERFASRTDPHATIFRLSELRGPEA
jgi:16S rRNA (guanine527-N7)-methyltransferase